MEEMIFDKHMKGLWFVYKNQKPIASISKRFRRRLYYVSFYNNKKIKNCTTRTLTTAKELIKYFLMERN